MALSLHPKSKPFSIYLLTKNKNNMKKTYRMMLALVALLLGAVNVSAGERIPLTEELFTKNFCAYTGWGADAVKGDPSGGQVCKLNEVVTDCAWGSGGCDDRMDLGAYSKLYIKAEGCADGAPNGSDIRIFVNRVKTDAGNNDLILKINDVNTNFCSKLDDGTLVVDLIKIKKEYGYVFLHAVKGGSYGAQLILYSIEVEKASAAQQVGWVDLIVNGDMEGSDEESILPETNYSVDMTFIGVEPGSESSFYSKEAAGSAIASVIEDGAGVDGSRGIKIHSEPPITNDWDAQFWINGSEELPEGAKYKVEFDYRASRNADADTQTHGTPSAYIIWHCIGSPKFTTEWQHFEYEGTVENAASDNNMAGAAGDDNSKFHSIAFNLAKDRENPVDYYFDNIKFQVYKYGASAKFCGEAIQIDFGFDTNVAELAKKLGATRVIFPNDCFKVTVNGKVLDNESEVISFEGFDDGRFFIFPEDILDDADDVQVSFINPADEAYRLIYTSGSQTGSAVGNFDGTATFDDDMALNVPLPSEFDTPTMMTSDPVDGSFNLSPAINTFTVTFDKEVNCELLVAKLDNEALTVSPATGAAKEVTLTRTGTDALADGKHKITLDKIFPETVFSEDLVGSEEINISVGPVVDDPNDKPMELIPLSYFNDSPSGEIPQGFKAFDDSGNERLPGTNYTNNGNGNRLQDAAGGDFTKCMYIRTYSLIYGDLDEDHELNLTAGKTYDISFNLAGWGNSGNNILFQIVKADNEAVVNGEGSANGEILKGSGDAKANPVKGTFAYTKAFTPTESGKYLLKWVVCNDKGEPSNENWGEQAIANVKMSYTPDVAGLKETNELKDAIAKAKTTLDLSNDERHHGEAFDALDAAIKKHEAGLPTYTAPSQCSDAVAELNKLGDELAAHKALVDKYDGLAKELHQLVVDNADTKFAKLELYQELKGFRDEYGEIEVKDGVDSDGNPIKEQIYNFTKFTDDDDLNTAINNIDAKLANAKKMFTDIVDAEGNIKKTGTSTGNTGIAVLLQRLRLGALALDALKITDSDDLKQAVKDALDNDDVLAAKIQKRITLDIYEKLKGGAENLFPVDHDDATLEETTPVYDLSVFLKNPNVYRLHPAADPNNNSNDISADQPENVPEGWVVNSGSTKLSPGWSPYGSEDVPYDVMWEGWGATFNVSTTIENLPAGVYTINFAFGERVKGNDSNKDEEANQADLEPIYAYAYTSETAEEPAKQVVPHIGQSFPTLAQNRTVIEGVTVTDGILTLGLNVEGGSVFCEDVQILLTAPAEGFPYATEYQNLVDAVEAAAAAATVKSVEIFDINGAQLPVAKKGVNIVKKTMSDGTIITEKIVK